VFVQTALLKDYKRNNIYKKTNKGEKEIKGILMENYIFNYDKRGY
jgi:hypothetical protein